MIFLLSLQILMASPSGHFVPTDEYRIVNNYAYQVYTFPYGECLVDEFSNGVCITSNK